MSGEKLVIEIDVDDPSEDEIHHQDDNLQKKLQVVDMTEEEEHDGHNDYSQGEELEEHDNDDDDDDDSWKDADFLSLHDNKNDDNSNSNDNDNDNDNDRSKRPKINNGSDHDDDDDDDDNQSNNIDDLRFNENSSIRDQMAIPNVTLHTSKAAPWMTLKCLPGPPLTYPNRAHAHTIPPLLKLHNEIVGFSKLISPQDFEIQSREKLAENIKQVAHDIFGGSKSCEIVIFGSLATKLFLPTSDIDIVINLNNSDKKNKDKSDSKKSKTRANINTNTNNDNDNDDEKAQIKIESIKDKEHREMQEWDNEADNRSPLIRLADGLRSFFKDQLVYLEVVEQTRIPIVKFTHGPTNLSVDVCFDQEGGPEAAQIMNNFLDNMPPLRPLVFVLKYFMAIRGINEPYSGGMGSFMLQMMIVSFLQHRAREEYTKYKRSILMNLGVLLLDFFEFYALDFNYITTAISVRNDGSYFPKGASEKREHFYQPLRPNSLAIENPLDLTSDVGKSTFRMNQIQRSFDVAYRLLLAHVSIPVVPAVSILAAILPPTEELEKRAVLLNTLNINNDKNQDHDDHDDSTEGENDTDHRHNHKHYKHHKHHSRNKKVKKNHKKRKRQSHQQSQQQQHSYSESSDEDNYYPMQKQSKHKRPPNKHKKRKNHWDRNSGSGSSPGKQNNKKVFHKRRN